MNKSRRIVNFSRLLGLSLLFFLATALTRAAEGEFNIRDYGAVGDGKSLDTDAINQAIEAASKAGGGKVYFPAGTYLSYTIRLKMIFTYILRQELY